MCTSSAGAAGADVDQGTAQLASLDGRGCQWHGRLQHDVFAASAECRVSLQAQFPGQGQPEGRIFRHLEFLQLGAGNARGPVLSQHPFHGVAGRGEAGDTAPQLAAADLALLATAVRKAHDLFQVLPDPRAGKFVPLFFAPRHQCRHRPAIADNGRQSVDLERGWQGQSEPWRRCEGLGAGKLAKHRGEACQQQNSGGGSGGMTRHGSSSNDF
jgi:hypothetical protein